MTADDIDAIPLLFGRVATSEREFLHARMMPTCQTDVVNLDYEPSIESMLVCTLY